MLATIMGMGYGTSLRRKNSPMLNRPVRVEVMIIHACRIRLKSFVLLKNAVKVSFVRLYNMFRVFEMCRVFGRSWLVLSAATVKIGSFMCGGCGVGRPLTQVWFRTAGILKWLRLGERLKSSFWERIYERLSTLESCAADRR
jgi:hypothetical protein